MADPLSVAASVVGLLAAGAKLASLLSKTASVIDAPSSMQAVLTEMRDISAALQYLQRFLNGLMDVPVGRQQYILVEHLEGTLTGCVITYDELEDFIDGMATDASDMGVLDRFKWARKEKDVASIVQRLQHHKSSLNLMLTTLQCATSSELQQSVLGLYKLFEQEVNRNSALSLRLSRVERNQWGVARSRLHDSVYSDQDNATIRPEGGSNIIDSESGEFGLFSFAFEHILIESRVYSRANFLPGDSHSETSMTSSNQRNAASAIFSSQNSAEISNLSVYMLPITLDELKNKAWYISIASQPEFDEDMREQTMQEQKTRDRDQKTRDEKIRDKKMQIYVKDFSGRTRFLSISGSTTGLELKEMCERQISGWGMRDFALVFHGRNIEDTGTLLEQGIGKDVTISAHTIAKWSQWNSRNPMNRNRSIIVNMDRSITVPRLERFNGG